jgi:1-phosphatidylinositol-4-phosphate 5-kinase
VSVLSPSALPTLTIGDFKATNRFDVKRRERDLSKVCSRHSFQFTEYAPDVFRRLRCDTFGIDAADYMMSLTRDYDSVRSSGASAGKSSSVFYFSADGSYLIKTLNSGEVKKLVNDFLPSYFMHVRDQPDTLLSRLVGLYAVSSSFYTATTYFLAMANIFPSPASGLKLSEKFDLKGSHIDRGLTAGERIRSSVPIQKDLEFARRHLLLGPARRAHFLAQLRADCDFLQRAGRVDYSLLLGVVRNVGDSVSQLQREQQVYSAGRASAFQLDAGGGYRSSTLQNQPHKELYFFGIIDFIQDFDLFKQLENTVKSLQHADDKEGFSIVAPERYAKRFVDFLDAHTGWPGAAAPPSASAVLYASPPSMPAPPPPSQQQQQEPQTSVNAANVELDLNNVERAQAPVEDLSARLRPRSATVERIKFADLNLEAERIAQEALDFDDDDMFCDDDDDDDDDGEKHDDSVQKVVIESSDPSLPSSSSSSSPNVIKSGWMVKRGNVVKNWKRRWFILHSDGKLSYWRSPDDRDCIASIQLRGSSVSMSTHTRRKHCFELSLSNRCYALSCDDDVQCHEWIDTLDWCISRVSASH